MIGAPGTDLAELAKYMIKNGPHKTESMNRRVRVIHNQATIVDTTKVLRVWEQPKFPQYYIPQGELKNCKMDDKERICMETKDADAAVVNLVIPPHDGLKEAQTDRVIRFADEKGLGPLAGMVRLEFMAMDQWLEEDSRVYFHPKNPYTRMDCLQSQRPIEIKIMGKTVAKTQLSIHLLETGLPPRYYMPLTSIDQGLLRKSSQKSVCPYKGVADHYSVVVDGKEMKDAAWCYASPFHEVSAIAGMVCFYNEWVDIILDGELQPKPS